MFGVSLLASLQVYADVGKSAVGVLMGVSGSVSGWIESVDHVGFVIMLLSQTLIFKVVPEWSKTVWTAEIQYICEAVIVCCVVAIVRVVTDQQNEDGQSLLKVAITGDDELLY